MGALETLVDEMLQPVLSRLERLEQQSVRVDALEEDMGIRAKALVNSLVGLTERADQYDTQLKQVNTSLLDQVGKIASDVKRVSDVNAALGSRVDRLDREARRQQTEIDRITSALEIDGAEAAAPPPPRAKRPVAPPVIVAKPSGGRCPTCGAKAAALYSRGKIKVCNVCSPSSEAH
jgi:hypothetical protein